jgi:aldose 1-epimerase
VGGAILLPYANRIRGKLAPDGKNIITKIAGKTVSLPANWQGRQPGAEKHSMHGLVLSAKFDDVSQQNGPTTSTASAVLHAGDFGGRWPSKTDVNVETSLKDDALEMTITARNVGSEPLPMGIGLHPAFVLPSGNRAQAKLHLPAGKRVVVNNYDDVFPTGKLVAVKSTQYDFTAPGGKALGEISMDDCFTELKRGPDGSAVVELIDPATNYGLRIVALSPEIKAVQVYAPPDRSFVAVEPQFNLADPYNAAWGKTDTGMVSLKPGESVSWRMRLELFVPSK